MAFTKTGVVTAPKIVPSAFGLLAVTKPENAPGEDQWVRGFSQEWETELYAATNSDDTNSVNAAFVQASVPTYYDEIKPFFIEAEEYRSTLGFNGLDRIERLKRQLEGITQHALEHELWDGTVRIPADHQNLALTSAVVTKLNDGVAVSPRQALAILEHGIGQASHGGEQGVIHLTRDAATLMSSNGQMFFHEEGRDHLQTLTGTPVVIGSGYSGNGPRTDAEAVSVSSYVATITTSGNHWLAVGETVNMSVTSDNVALIGNYDVTAVVDEFTFKVAIAQDDVAEEDATGFVQMAGTSEYKWIYATGTVKTYIGDIDVVNDNLSQAYDVSGNANDMRLKAIRPAAVYFDTSIHLAVKVDLTA